MNKFDNLFFIILVELFPSQIWGIKNTPSYSLNPSSLGLKKKKKKQKQKSNQDTLNSQHSLPSTLHPWS